MARKWPENLHVTEKTGKLLENSNYTQARELLSYIRWVCSQITRNFVCLVLIAFRKIWNNASSKDRQENVTKSNLLPLVVVSIG